jgi:subtilisin family serine protease
MHRNTKKNIFENNEPQDFPKDSNGNEYYPSEVIVRFSVPGLPEQAKAAARAAVGATSAKSLSGALGIELMKFPQGTDTGKKIQALKNNRNIKYAEVNYRVHKVATSIDPYFINGNLWGMYGASTSPSNEYGSNAAEAWANGVGTPGIVVGIIDEGIDINHPE